MEYTYPKYACTSLTVGDGQLGAPQTRKPFHRYFCSSAMGQRYQPARSRHGLFSNQS